MSACAKAAAAASRAPALAAALPSGLAASPRLRLLDLPFDRFRDILIAEGRPAYRAAQVWGAVFRRADPHALAAPPPAVPRFADMTALPAADREWLNGAFALDDVGAAFTSESASSDGTLKWLYASPSGDGASVETVYIPDAPARRGTVCVSSQVGCSLACAFCRTGTQPLSRNLSAGDIVGQVLAAARAVDARRAAWREQQHQQPQPQRGRGDRSGGRWPHPPPPSPLPPPPVNRVVLMGQGEPLMNYTAVLRALHALTHPSGFGLAPHRITLSTAGVAPLLGRLGREGPLGLRLAVSLHAPTDGLRGQLMDVNARWPLAAVMAGVREYITACLERQQQQEEEKERAQVQGASKRRGSGGSSASSRTGRGRGAVVAAHSDDDEFDSDSDDDDDDDEDGGGGGAPSLRTAAGDRHQRHNGRRRVRVSFEYVGLASNTNPEVHAAQLVELVRRARIPLPLVHVNLIPFNEWAPSGGALDFGAKRAPPPPGLVAPAPPGQLAAFQRALMAAGLRATVRASRGRDILGACGQLKSSTTTSPASSDEAAAKPAAVAAA